MKRLLFFTCLFLLSAYFSFGQDFTVGNRIEGSGYILVVINYVDSINDKLNTIDYLFLSDEGFKGRKNAKFYDCVKKINPENYSDFVKWNSKIKLKKRGVKAALSEYGRIRKLSFNYYRKFVPDSFVNDLQKYSPYLTRDSTFISYEDVFIRPVIPNSAKPGTYVYMVKLQMIYYDGFFNNYEVFLRYFLGSTLDSKSAVGIKMMQSPPRAKVKMVPNKGGRYPVVFPILIKKIY